MLLLGLTTACEDEIVTAPPNAGKAPPRRGAEAVANDETKVEKLPTIELEEADFVESDRSRDPFRSYAQAFVEEARGAVKSQREVLLDQYSLEELKLVGIVGNAEPARAMFVDPAGVGHVVTRGQYVGRASVVQPAGGVGASYEVNWRIDRIRDGDVVFVRDDPSNPSVPSATRVVQLRVDDEMVEDQAGTQTGDVASQLAELKAKLKSLESEEAARRGQSFQEP